MVLKIRNYEGFLQQSLFKCVLLFSVVPGLHDVFKKTCH